MSKDKSIDFTLNDEKVRKILPKKPSEWSYKEVKTFLKEIVKMDNTVLDFFDEQEINGKKFLNIDFKDENDEILTDLNLRRNDEKKLFECQKQLKNYEESFKGTTGSQQPNKLEKTNSKMKKRESSSSKDEKKVENFKENKSKEKKDPANVKEKKSDTGSVEDLKKHSNKYNFEIKKEVSKIEENPSIRKEKLNKEVAISKKPEGRLSTDKDHDDQNDKGKKKTPVNDIDEESDEKEKTKKHYFAESLKDPTKEKGVKKIGITCSEPLDKKGIFNNKKLEPDEKLNEEIKIGFGEDSDDTKTKDPTIENKFKREIIINVVNDNAQHERYSFISSFQIHRASNGVSNMDTIPLDDRSVSHKHAQVVLLKGLGFALQDLGSRCHTFIKVKEKSRIKLKEGIEILIGKTTFKILSLTKSQIKFETKKDREKMNLEIKINKDKLFFGSDPRVNDPQNEDAFKYEEDSFIELTHVIFHKEPDRILLEPRLSATGVWVKIGNKGENSDFFLLTKYMIFKISTFLLKVEYTIGNKDTICLCKSCHSRKINTVFLSCYHAHLCDICADERKKCSFKTKNSVCESQEFKKLINILEQD